jgi:hypothetical protein
MILPNTPPIKQSAYPDNKDDLTRIGSTGLQELLQQAEELQLQGTAETLH